MESFRLKPSPTPLPASRVDDVFPFWRRSCQGYEGEVARHNTETGPGEAGCYRLNVCNLFHRAGGMSEGTAPWFKCEYDKNPQARIRKAPSPELTASSAAALAGSKPPITLFFRSCANDRVRTASTIKLPILAAVFQAVADSKAFSSIGSPPLLTARTWGEGKI